MVKEVVGRTPRARALMNHPWRIGAASRTDGNWESSPYVQP